MISAISTKTYHIEKWENLDMDNQISYKRKYLDCIILCCVFAIGFFLYYINCVNYMDFYNSDHTYYALAGKDIMSGNIFLKDWYGSTNTFYFTCLLYGIFGKFLGYSEELLYVVSSFVWASFTTLVSYYTLLIFKGEKKYQKYMRVFLIVILLFSSCYFSQTIKILAGYHLDVLLLGTVYVWFISKEINECQMNNFLITFITSCLLLLAIWTDQLITLFLVAPIIFTLFLNLVFFKHTSIKNKIILKNLLLTIVLFVLSKVIWKVLENTFGTIQLTWSTNNIRFITYEEFFPRIAFFIEEILYLFNCDILGKTLNIQNLILIVRLLFLFVLVFGFLISIKHILKNIFNQILCTSAVVISCVILLTNYALFTDGIPYTSRLMYYFFVPAVIVFTQIEWDKVLSYIKVKISEVQIKFLGLLTLIFFSMIILVSIKPVGESVRQESTFNKVANELVSRNLKRGYGSFWLSNVITLTSQCNVEVNPISNGFNLSKFKWLSQDTGQWDSANFILVDDSNWDNMSRETVIECVGKPDEEILIDNVYILIWNKNIMPYIDDSGYRGKNLDFWWDLEGEETSKHIQPTNRHFYSWFEANEQGYFTSNKEGQLLYGPFKSLDAGIYNITFYFNYENIDAYSEKIGYVDVFSAQNSLQHKVKDILSNDSKVTLENVVVYENCLDAELRVYADIPGITAKEIIVERIDDVK